MVSEEHVIDQLPAYALDCLDTDELAEVAAHLHSCASCRQELEAYQALADQLPFALAQTSPPPGLKRRVLGSLPAHPDSSGAQEQRRQVTAPRPRPWQDRLRAAWRQGAPALALASLALVLLLVASNLLLWRQVNQFKQAQMPVIALLGVADAEHAVGTIVISRDGEHGSLVVDGLEPLDENRQYQLWLIKDGQRTSGGVFMVNPDGYATLYIKSPRSLASFTGFGITIEPAGGSPQPTGKKVMGGEI